MSGPLLTMFAKAPVPGRVKTRLQPPLSPEEAASLHGCFLLDQAQRLLAHSGWTGWLSAAGEVEHPVFAQIAQMGVEVVPQRGSDLGDRMACAIEQGLAAGFSSVTLIGSDSPTLPVSLLEQNLALLERAEVALAPSFDGGFVAISARVPVPALRGPIPWSVQETLDRTVEALRAQKVLVALGGFWYDVDQSEDLDFLARHMRALGKEHGAPHTQGWLAQHQRADAR